MGAGLKATAFSGWRTTAVMGFLGFAPGWAHEATALVA
jgi:hypothetical protein